MTFVFLSLCLITCIAIFLITRRDDIPSMPYALNNHQCTVPGWMHELEMPQLIQTSMQHDKVLCQIEKCLCGRYDVDYHSESYMRTLINRAVRLGEWRDLLDATAQVDAIRKHRLEKERA